VSFEEIIMSAMRQPGKINENTTLVDIGMEDVYGMTAVYLVRGNRTCLIDAGTRAQAPRLIKLLGELDASPPDLIVVTHPHWDHAQGIPLLRQMAARLGKQIEVLASSAAIPLLADASFNDVFGGGPYQSIQAVTPVKEGDTIDLGGIALRIYEVPGHCRGHLAILDEENRNLFVGDALGDKVSDDIFLPPFMPSTWDPDAFLSSVNKLRLVPYETLCLAHFGCIGGSEAKSILDEAVETCNTWWQFYEKHADRLSDTDYLLQAMRKEINPGIPIPRPMTFRLKVLLGLVSAVGSVMGRKTAIMDKLAFSDILGWLATGYRMYTSAH
jgi:glyoxylase-like metal-dependent hydrolase (beta-lactamase superfamily II)